MNRTISQGILRVSNQATVRGFSPSPARYLNFNERDFLLYLGICLQWITKRKFKSLIILWAGGVPEDHPSFQRISQIYSSFNGCISSVSLGPFGGIQTLQLDSATYGERVSQCNVESQVRPQVCSPCSNITCMKAIQNLGIFLVLYIIIIFTSTSYSDTIVHSTAETILQLALHPTQPTRRAMNDQWYYPSNWRQICYGPSYVCLSSSPHNRESHDHCRAKLDIAWSLL